MTQTVSAFIKGQEVKALVPSHFCQTLSESAHDSLCWFLVISVEETEPNLHSMRVRALILYPEPKAGPSWQKAVV